MKTSLLKSSKGLVEILGRESLSREATIVTNSKDADHKKIFIALNGEKFRAIDFVDEVLLNGCRDIIIECKDEQERERVNGWRENFPDSCFYIVNNANEFFLNVASQWADHWREQGQDRFLIGLTGSNGKTTCKEILKHLLEGIFPGEVLATEGNLNNLFGVPMTLLKLNDHRVGVIEMGTNSPGEIAMLARAVSPEAGLITNIGHAHLEKLKGRDGVFKEKSDLYREFEKNDKAKFFVVNASDEYLCQLTGEKLKTIQLQETLQNDGDYKIDNNVIKIKANDQIIKIQNNHLCGRHNLNNLALCFYLCTQIFKGEGQKEKLLLAANSYRPKEMNRGSWIQKSGQEVYLDAYNANPDSMKCAIETFTIQLQDKVRGNKDKQMASAVFVLGDMNELGDYTSQGHRDVAQFLEENIAALKNFNIYSHVFFVGRYHRFYTEGFGESENMEVYSNVDSLKDRLLSLQQEGRFYFLKGSRSLQLEGLLDIFE